MVQGTLKIHTENILPIIKKWLYSDKDIFIRELISNACDALQKVKVLQHHGELIQGEPIQHDQELRIDITLDKGARTLTIADTGIGMTADEVEKYIAQIAFSGAEEFLGKYQSQNESDQIIGHFGLGFYSAYMVSEKVEINTLSYQPQAESVCWSCDGTHSYTLDAGTRATRGTAITLFIDKDSDEFLEEKHLGTIIQHYCAFLPFPISLNGTHLNHKDPLWVKPVSECTDEDYLDFYRTLYPADEDPVFWVHLNVDYPFRLKGVLFFPKITRRFDWNRSNIKLFCNRVFVSDNCKDLIPDYLMVLKGALDSPDIPLNVSRSTLQLDKTVRQLSSHIAKKIADRLSFLYQNHKDQFIEAWTHVEMIVKLGILQDDKFYERAKDFLIWKNLLGEWTTLKAYQESHQQTDAGKVFYTSEDTTQAPSPFLDVYKAKGIDVLYANAHLDGALMSFLESKQPALKFQRIDGGIDAAILDADKEKGTLDADGKTEAVQIAAFIKAQLNLDKLHVEAKSLASDSLPAFIVLDEEMRRMRDYMALSNQQVPSGLFMGKQTLVVNTNSPLIASLYALKDKDPELSKEIAHHIYELSLLSQKELEPSALAPFIARSTKVMSALLTRS